MGMGLTGAAFAQSTTGSLFGSAEAGDTVQISSSTGVSRSTTVDARGRYNFSNLPLGTYKVSLLKGDATVDSRDNVDLRVNAGTDVSFNAPASGNAQELAAVTVTGSSLPPIDVSSVDSRTVVTRQQLDRLPLGRSAEAIALLAPGVTPGSTGSGFASPTGQALVSFGGSSISENAYYINGMNTTDPISGYGGIVLPYGAIDQQEVLTGGYGAAYGRSDGGVISVVGRRGTNEWHFGAQILYTPKWASADPKNWHYAGDSANAGELNRYRVGNKSWDTTVSAYAGGPLIKDKLFLFVAAEAEKQEGKNVSSVDSNQQTNYSYRDPKTYVKLDWNINDNNLLEVTGAQYKNTYQGTIYDYDYDTLSRADYKNKATEAATKQNMWIAKFTSYITDDLTLTAQYGRQQTDFYTQPDADPNQIHVINPSRQNPNYTGGAAGGIPSPLAITTIGDPRKQSKASNYRVDLAYKIGDHTISAGIDNQSSQDNDDGDSIYSNAGFAYNYGVSQPNAQLAAGQVQGTPDGYYVTKYRYQTAASVAVRQRAQYVEDKWQVNDRWLLNIGLRNDQFTNYNGSGQAYINQHKPQWAPRLGASWDVFGDSTFKVYANAGRYYLALPLEPALRGASGSYFTQAYYSYTGVDPATGAPLGLAPLQGTKGPDGEYSANNEFGQSPDPKIVTAKGLDPEYQDEFIAGFDKTLGADWIYGAKLTYRKLGNAIDDYCDLGEGGALQGLAAAKGLNLADESYGSCYLFNPGRANTFLVANTATGGYDQLHVSNKELGFPHLKRAYYAVNLHLEHPMGNTKWFGRADYVYSKSYGNSEGQVDSDAGIRSAPSVTQAWDNAQVMSYSNGLLPNDHKHQFKFYGSYQITPEWAVAGNLQIMSGSPRNCYGGYGQDQIEANANYGFESYHYCGGIPSPPGDAGRNSWIKTLALSTSYRPAFADHKLAFSVEIFNVTNEQKATQVSPYYGVSYAPDTDYKLPLSSQTPRYVRFGATYDF